MNVEIRKAQPENLPAMLHLLQMVDLPVEGVKEHIATFLVATDSPRISPSDLRIIACVGLEMYTPSALLRSLAISPSYQRQGLGTTMIEAILDLAKKQGIRQLFLLTDSALDFFHKLGFDDIHRDQVPQNVRQSIEFTKLCPTAPCLTKKI